MCRKPFGLYVVKSDTYGAEVVLYDRDNDDRDAIGATIAQERGLVLIMPFDNAEVIAGQGSIGLEIAQDFEQGFEGEVQVLTCCGGGGMSAGVALALEGQMQVRPCEPEGFDDTARSLISGQRERNVALSGSICDAIVTPSPGELTFPIMQRLCGPGLVVTDDEVQRAMALAYEHLRIVVEPGGAVALAAALFRPELPDTVIAVASGGNVDAALFAQVLSRYGA